MLCKITNDSDSEDDLAVDESSSYSLSHFSSSESFESDSEKSLPDSSYSNHNVSSDDHLPGTWHIVEGTYRTQLVFADDGGIFGFSGIALDE